MKHRLDAFGLQRLLYSPCNELFDKPREGKVKDDGEYMTVLNLFLFECTCLIDDSAAIPRMQDPYLSWQLSPQ